MERMQMLILSILLNWTSLIILMSQTAVFITDITWQYSSDSDLMKTSLSWSVLILDVSCHWSTENFYENICLNILFKKLRARSLFKILIVEHMNVRSIFN